MVLINWYHFTLAFLGALVYEFPSRKLTVIGVTGTNGKTTTVSLSTKILEEAGYKVASASSIKFKIGSQERENKLKMTMPGRFALQKFLRQAVNAGCQYAVLEVTSEGVLQHRHRFIDFDVAVFTNLSPEHIERHGSFENYRAAKASFFRAVNGTHIINLDDKNAEYFLQFPAKRKLAYTFKIDSVPTPVKLDRGRNTVIVVAKNIQEEKKGMKFNVQNVQFKLNLLGKFNVYNALAAVCVGLSQGISLEVCQKALEKAEGVPGRMEQVISQPFKVIVDYAFTPNALEQVYKTLKIKESGSPCDLICVLGACGGGRDKWKRPVLGEIATKYCQKIIITNEDPYDEPPMDIINQVADGVERFQGVKLLSGKEFNSFQISKILDRREAIKKALGLAQPGDAVIITGKGCEPWICVAHGKKIPWDDRQVVREEFKKLKNYEKI